MKIIAAIRPTSAHTASDAAQENWKPAEDVGNYDQGRSGTSLLTASLRFRTMEKGQIGATMFLARGELEPGVSPPEAWSTQLVIPA